MAGITSIEEVIALCQLVTVETIKAVKTDGFQVSDLVAALQAPDFDEKLQAVINDASSIPAEAADISIFEGITLAKDVQKFFAAVVSALKSQLAFA